MKNKTLIRLFSSLLVVLIAFGSMSLIGSAATEDTITSAEAKITVVPDAKSVKTDDILTVTVKLSTEYYITNIQLPVLFDKTQFEVVGKTASRAYLTFSEMFSERNYLFGGRADKQNGFAYTSDHDKWNTEEAKAKYGVAYITAVYDPSIGNDSTYAMPQNDVFATFQLKALTDVSDTTESVFVSSDWAKTATNKKGILTIGMTTADDYYTGNVADINYAAVSYTTETKTDTTDISYLKLLRGTASVKSYKGTDYLAITMAEGRTMTGIYKDMTDGGTVELVDIVGNVQDRAGDYVAYQSQNETNPVATMKITYADGTVETIPVVFELYEMEREITFDISKNIRPIRGKASLATDEKGDYILVEMLDGQSSVGVYKATTDGKATATLLGAEGMHTEQEKLYIFYGSQNTFNPEGRLTVTTADGSTGTYRVVFKMYEMDPYVNAAKGLRPVRGAVTFDADGTIRIKMTAGQTSVGLYKTMANGATFQLVDANGKVTNNPSSIMFYMTNNPANVTATMIFTLPDGTTKEQKIIFDMGLADNPDPLVYLTAVRGTVSYKEDYIEVKANDGSTGVGINKDCLVKYTLTDIDGVMTENDTRYYLYKSQNPDGATANINFLQSDGSYKTYTIKFVF